MVYELSCRYIPDPATDVLLESNEIVTLDEYIRQEVASRHPAYIVGDSIDSGYFSVRFPAPQDRNLAIDFIAVIKPYMTAGRVQGHECYHDVGGPCGAVEVLDAWGEGLDDEI